MAAPLEERIDHAVMGGTEHDHTAVPRQLGAAQGDWFNVMNMERATTLPGNPAGEVALSVVESARAKFAPRLCVVQGRHMRSLADTVPNRMDGEPIFGSTYPQLLNNRDGEDVDGDVQLYPLDDRDCNMLGSHIRDEWPLAMIYGRGTKSHDERTAIS